METIDDRVGIVGDVHGNWPITEKCLRALAAEGVTVAHFLGDFAFLWTGQPREWSGLKRLRLLLEELGMTALVTGGNHEGYDAWDNIEQDDRGIRWINKRVGLLPRGWRAQSSTGKVIASLGGANSIDRYNRRPHYGWWPQESITEEDLQALGTEPADVLLGHDSPQSKSLIGRLVQNEHYWTPKGLAWAQLGHEMFHRGFLQVRPSLTLGGHYHMFIDSQETFEAPDDTVFDSRVIVMNADGHWPTVAVLDTTDATVTYVDAFDNGPKPSSWVNQHTDNTVTHLDAFNNRPKPISHPGRPAN